MPRNAFQDFLFLLQASAPDDGLARQVQDLGGAVVDVAIEDYVDQGFLRETAERLPGYFFQRVFHVINEWDGEWVRDTFDQCIPVQTVSFAWLYDSVKSRMMLVPDGCCILYRPRFPLFKAETALIVGCATSEFAADAYCQLALQVGLKCSKCERAPPDCCNPPVPIKHTSFSTTFDYVVVPSWQWLDTVRQQKDVYFASGATIVHYRWLVDMMRARKVLNPEPKYTTMTERTQRWQGPTEDVIRWRKQPLRRGQMEAPGRFAFGVHEPPPVDKSTKPPLEDVFHNGRTTWVKQKLPDESSVYVVSHFMEERPEIASQPEFVWTPEWLPDWHRWCYVRGDGRHVFVLPDELSRTHRWTTEDWARIQDKGWHTMPSA